MPTPSKYKKPYWEREKPKTVLLGKNVFKIFIEAGKVQVYPKVETAKNGVGRGSTIDIEKMNKTDRKNLIKIIEYAVEEYNKKEK